ncbi:MULTISPECIES: hypothetical protein [unclassified Nocardia]|uniref:hypothetical protein n=1 Tax=unclassified Nocardia TaxID=2637762 RepID=UPI0024A81E27|nr:MULTISPECIES: hypothetical protein [unclassified Nocardia]
MSSRIRFEGLWYDVPGDRIDTVVRAIAAARHGQPQVVSLPRPDGYVHLLVTAQSSIILETDTMIEFPNGFAQD